MAKKKNTPEAAPAQPEQAAAPAYRFTTLREVVEDPYFLVALKTQLNIQDKTRANILKKNSRARLKRSAYDDLYDKGQRTPEAIQAIYVDIVHGRSKEAARVRDYVSALCGEAVTQTINHYPLTKEEPNEQ